RFVYTYYEALTLLAKFSTRLNCLRELIGYFSLHAFVAAWRFRIIKLPMGEIFNAVRTLSSKPSGSQSTKPVISPFRFTSSAQSWFANDPPLDLRQPTWETYVLRATVGQPNPLASRLGPQWLCLELNSEDVRKRQYDRLLVAGAFICPILSDDTLSFLCELASGAVCGQTDWTAHSNGWVLIDRECRSFTQFQSLCGLKTPVLLTSTHTSVLNIMETLSRQNVSYIQVRCSASPLDRCKRIR
ncbi:hypothetical protein AHF37_09991, partial [Paragonimus kellicotti]